MKISEMFISLAGEGRYVGHPLLFIRLSNCTRSCDFCDTKWHKKGSIMKTKDIIQKAINMAKKNKYNVGELPICWTGGEPLLQKKDIIDIMKNSRFYFKKHYIETNGDILTKDDFKLFNYVCISPKDNIIASKVKQIVNNLTSINYDIKIVTDLDKIGVDMLDKATMLMPLTTYNQKKDKEIKQKVWDYCVKHNKIYTPRIHVDLFGNKRGI